MYVTTTSKALCCGDGPRGSGASLVRPQSRCGSGKDTRRQELRGLNSSLNGIFKWKKHVFSVTFIDTKACSSNYWEREAKVIMCVFGSLALERMPDTQSVTSTV